MNAVTRICTCRTELKAREAQLKNFFQNVEVAVRGAGDQTTTSARWEVGLTFHVRCWAFPVQRAKVEQSCPCQPCDLM
jgi:hypothetical protein